MHLYISTMLYFLEEDDLFKIKKNMLIDIYKIIRYFLGFITFRLFAIISALYYFQFNVKKNYIKENEFAFVMINKFCA